MLVINAFFFPVHKTVSAFSRTLGAEIYVPLVADSLYDSISALYKKKRTDLRHSQHHNFVFANNFNGHKLRRTFTPLNYFLIIPLLYWQLYLKSNTQSPLDEISEIQTVMNTPTVVVISKLVTDTM